MPKQPAEFEFFHALKESTVFDGFIYRRDDEMILEIDDITRWDIHGKQPSNGTFFEGQHKQQPGDPFARAKWALLDDIYVGVWIEDAQEYLFRFHVREAD